MLDGLIAFIGGALPVASIDIAGLARREREVGVTRRPPESGADTRSFAVTPGILRLAALGAMAVDGLPPLIEFWRVAAADGASVRYAAAATAVTMVLHLRHVAFALRNERPPAGPWTLAALALVNVAATILVGRAWAMQFASLAVSALIVVRGPAAPLLVGRIPLSPLIIADASLQSWQITGLHPMVAIPTIGIVLSVAWRTVTLYIPVRLVAMIQQLDAARRSLESTAVIQTRSRIEADLRNGLAQALQRITSRSEAARGAVGRDPARAATELGVLVTDSRRALADARRIAASYRTPSLHAELEAATSLLQAAGSTYRLVVAQNVPVESAGWYSSGAIRAAVMRALEADGQQAGKVIHVTLDEAGQLRVDVT